MSSFSFPNFAFASPSNAKYLKLNTHVNIGKSKAQTKKSNSNEINSPVASNTTPVPNTTSAPNTTPVPNTKKLKITKIYSLKKIKIGVKKGKTIKVPIIAYGTGTVKPKYKYQKCRIKILSKPSQLSANKTRPQYIVNDLFYSYHYQSAHDFLNM
jgi:hypothetical protein